MRRAKSGPKKEIRCLRNSFSVDHPDVSQNGLRDNFSNRLNLLKIYMLVFTLKVFILTINSYKRSSEKQWDQLYHYFGPFMSVYRTSWVRRLLQTCSFERGSDTEMVPQKVFCWDMLLEGFLVDSLIVQSWNFILSLVQDADIVGCSLEIPMNPELLWIKYRLSAPECLYCQQISDLRILTLAEGNMYNNSLQNGEWPSFWRGIDAWALVCCIVAV